MKTEIPSDAIHLAKAVLEGDFIAAGALADVVHENWSSKGPRLSAAYVESLEDLLHDFRRGWNGTTLSTSLMHRYSTLERWAKSLSRHGLS